MWWTLYLKGNNHSQYLKVFQRPIVSNVKQTGIPDFHDNNSYLKIQTVSYRLG